MTQLFCIHFFFFAGGGGISINFLACEQALLFGRVKRDRRACSQANFQNALYHIVIKACQCIRNQMLEIILTKMRVWYS